MRTLVWYRADLRVSDQPALAQACRQATRGVIAAFIICPAQWQTHDWADIKVDFILRHLRELSTRLARLNIPLLIRTVPTFDACDDALEAIAEAHDCTALFLNHEYEVNESRRDERIIDRWTKAGREVFTSHDQVMIEPGSLRTGKGDFYSVFSPFRRKWQKQLEDRGVPTPRRTPSSQPEMLCPPDDIPSAIKGFDRADSSAWPAGETAAKRRLSAFARERIDDYKTARDIPGVDGTSSLSPYLAVGSISMTQCLDAAVKANGEQLNGGNSGAATWISELVWREFYRHVLVGWPRVSMHRPFRLDTEYIIWRDAPDHLAAWKDGCTGFPIVDAGMRQLKATGWMHNRVRMICAMLLTKQLLIDWREGERYFMRHLIDGDLASNNGGWQWSASTGTDAAPYFRIFNPTSQSKRYDPGGDYIRRWVPELADVDAKRIHEPHAGGGLFAAALDYPEPIVDHAAARQRAIDAFSAL